MPKWRYVTPATKSRWYDTKREAQDAAIKAGLGSRGDDSGPSLWNTFYADVTLRFESKSE